MTLKTTKEQRDALLTYYVDPNGIVYNSIVRDLCHDADEARRMETEMLRLDAGWTEAMEDCHEFYSQVCLLKKENADLRAQLEEALIVLIPFSQPQFSEELGGNVEGAASIVYARNGAVLRIGDFRRAAAIRALKEQEKVSSDDK